MDPSARPQPGGLRPSMVDVARLAGVSHQTVSRVLNASELVRADTRGRVERAIVELGYRRNNAARALVTRRSQRLGLVIAHVQLYGPRMVFSGVQDAAHDAGYEVSVEGLEEFSRASLDRSVSRLVDQDVEAVIVAVAHHGAHDIAAGLNLGVPLVLAEGVEPGTPMAAGVDQRRGAELATAHLLDQGHTMLGHLAGPTDWIEAQQRQEGFKAVLAQHGRSAGAVVQCDWSAESGYRAAAELLDDASVTAVFAANDSLALGLLRACHERSVRVPEDLAVVGFDDLPEAAYFWPPLTTVRQDFRSLGASAVQLAVRGVAGEAEASLPLLEPSLVVRRSSIRVTS